MQISEYNSTAAGLAELQSRMQKVTYDVTNSLGMASARKDRAELVKLRTTLEAKRKELKAPALERSRLIDEEAAKIKAEILALEVPIDQQIKAEEDRKEAEKQRKLEENAKRISKIMEAIEKLRSAPERTMNKTAAEVNAGIEFLKNMDLTEEAFGEFLQMAQETVLSTLGQLHVILVDKVREEEEAARIEAERIAQLEAERIAREEEDKRIAIEREALRKQQEEFAKQQEEFEKLKAEQAKREKEDNDRMEGLRLEEEARIRKEQEARDLEQKRIQAEESERTRLANIELEKKRQTAERERKAAEKAKKLAEKKFKSLSDTLQAIQDICADDRKTDSEAREEISLICEANI